jgi:hypothetical protein
VNGRDLPIALLSVAKAPHEAGNYEAGMIDRHPRANKFAIGPNLICMGRQAEDRSFLLIGQH